MSYILIFDVILKNNPKIILILLVVNMLHNYITCGEWIPSAKHRWSFAVDEGKQVRLLALESTSTLKDLKTMVSENYGIERRDV